MSALEQIAKECFEYYMLHRPFGLGVVPSEHLEVVDDKLHNWTRGFGIVKYNRKLTDEEINQYELIDLSDSHFNELAKRVTKEIFDLGCQKEIENEKVFSQIINMFLEKSYSTKFDYVNRMDEFKKLVKMLIKVRS